MGGTYSGGLRAKHKRLRQEPAPEPPRWRSNSAKGEKLWRVMHIYSWRRRVEVNASHFCYGKYRCEAEALKMVAKHMRELGGSRKRGEFYIMKPDGSSYTPL